MKALVLSLLVLLTCGNSKINNKDIKEGYENVSLVSLISNPEKYHNKTIRVKGYVKFEKEGEAIYINEDDYMFFISKNGLALNINYKRLIEMDISYSAKGYAIVKGVFNKNSLGHYNSFSGSIGKIEYIDWLEGRNDKSKD